MLEGPDTGVLEDVMDSIRSNSFYRERLDRMLSPGGFYSESYRDRLASVVSRT